MAYGYDTESLSQKVKFGTAETTNATVSANGSQVIHITVTGSMGRHGLAFNIADGTLFAWDYQKNAAIAVWKPDTIKL